MFFVGLKAAASTVLLSAGTDAYDFQHAES
jgi:hypothetical protein